MDAMADNATRTLAGFLCPILCGNDATCSANCGRNIQQVAERIKATLQTVQARIESKARDVVWYAFIAAYLPWIVGFVIVLALLWMNRVITCTQMVLAFLLIIVVAWVLSMVASRGILNTMTHW